MTAGRTRRRIGADTWTTLFGAAYLALAANLLLVAVTLPLVLLLLGTDPRSSWLLISVAAVLAGPGLGALFTLFAAYAEQGWTAPVVRTFLHGWRATARRAAAIAATTSGVLVVLGVDIAAFWGRRAGAAAIPVLVVLIALVLLTAIGALALLAERPTARLRDLVRAALYLMVRRWYLSVVSVAVLSVLAALVVQAPAFGLGLAPVPAWYLVWANTRHALRPVLPTRAVVVTP
ncbi:MAG TPA: ferredoxin-NADPH reductase [Cellulomonas sp.]